MVVWFVIEFSAWAREGATWGSCLPPWNLKIVTLNAVSVLNTLNFSLALLALASDTLKISLKTSKKSRNISFAPLAR